MCQKKRNLLMCDRNMAKRGLCVNPEISPFFKLFFNLSPCALCLAQFSIIDIHKYLLIIEIVM